MGVGIQYVNEITNKVSQLTSVTFTPYDTFWQQMDVSLWEKIAMYLASTPEERRTMAEIAVFVAEDKHQVREEIERHKDQIWSDALTPKGKEHRYQLRANVLATYQLQAEMRG
jgi:hypothetical protein